jgi:bifunctional non-homologous end joining protein LigD
MKDKWARPRSGNAATRVQGKPKAELPGQATPVPEQRRGARQQDQCVTFTNPDKLLYLEAGLTKREVLEFYRRVAAHLLLFLRDRPATLERLAEGLGGANAPHFWQKNTPAFYPDWIERVALPSEHGKTVNYVLVNNQQTLLYLVNQGTLTFHV